MLSASASGSSGASLGSASLIEYKVVIRIGRYAQKEERREGGRLSQTSPRPNTSSTRRLPPRRRFWSAGGKHSFSSVGVLQSRESGGCDERRAVRSPARDVKYLPDSGAVCLNEEEDYIACWSGPGPRSGPVSTAWSQHNR